MDTLRKLCSCHEVHCIHGNRWVDGFWFKRLYASHSCSGKLIPDLEEFALTSVNTRCLQLLGMAPVFLLGFSLRPGVGRVLLWCLSTKLVIGRRTSMSIWDLWVVHKSFQCTCLILVIDGTCVYSKSILCSSPGYINRPSHPFQLILNYSPEYWPVVLLYKVLVKTSSRGLFTDLWSYK